MLTNDLFWFCPKWQTTTTSIRQLAVDLWLRCETNQKYPLTIYRIPWIVLIDFIGVDVPVWFSLWNQQKSNVYIHKPHNHLCWSNFGTLTLVYRFSFNNNNKNHPNKLETKINNDQNVKSNSGSVKECV